MSSSSHIGAILPAVLGLGLAAASAGYAQLPAIPTAREPVTNIYHGVAVVDDYQWLEDPANPAVRDWTRQQNERTRAYFDKLAFHDGLEQQLSELIADASAIYSLSDCRGGIIFATRFKPPAQQPVLVRLKSVYPPALRKVGVRSQRLEHQRHHRDGLVNAVHGRPADGHLPLRKRQ